ncbi:MAG: hypothetical protein ACTSXC_05635 [Candidatus Freyarchaeota archaeon]
MVPVVLMVSDMLNSIIPLMRFLGGLGIATSGTLILIGIVALMMFIILNGWSLGWLISIACFANVAYLVIKASPLIEIAFPNLHPFLMDVLEETVALPTSRAFYYISLLVVVSIVNGYIEKLIKTEKTMSKWEIPDEDILDIIYHSFLVMVMATVISGVIFLWAVDNLTGRRVDLGELYYLAPPLLLLVLGVSFSMGIFGRGKTKRNVLVIKARIPLGRSYSWKIEGDENLVVTVLTRDGKMQEREIRIETEVKELPKSVTIYIKNLRREGDDYTKKVPLRKVKESTDEDTRFLLYTNMRPVEF